MEFGPAHHTIATLFAGNVLCNIGQVPAHVQRQLDRLVRHGRAYRWRGHWFPVAGADWGIGPPKSCYRLVRD